MSGEAYVSPSMEEVGAAPQFSFVALAVALVVAAVVYDAVGLVNYLFAANAGIEINAGVAVNILTPINGP